MTEELRSLESWNCFACGPHHPKGLRLTFEADSDRVRSRFRLDDSYTGTGPVLHGGVIATVFDETMAWCLLRFQRQLYFTTKLEIRYRMPIRANDDLVAEARIERLRSRGLAELAADMRSDANPDAVLAQASAVFIVAPGDVMAELPNEQRREMEAMLAGFGQEIA